MPLLQVAAQIYFKVYTLFIMRNWSKCVITRSENRFYLGNITRRAWSAVLSPNSTSKSINNPSASHSYQLGYNTTGRRFTVLRTIAFTRHQDNRIQLKTCSKTFVPQMYLFWILATCWQNQIYGMDILNTRRRIFENACCCSVQTQLANPLVTEHENWT